MTVNQRPFVPTTGLTNPHLQTILSSVGRRLVLPRRLKRFLRTGIQREIDVEGVHFRVTSHTPPPGLRPNTPLICIVPGWLGSADSSYVLAAAAALYQAGFSVARINLRDHGGTAHLNRELFNSALIDEVVSLIQLLAKSNTKAHAKQSKLSQTGVLGFSLGGNFALRLAQHLPEITTLAVCPALAPAQTMHRIDANAFYQGYFVRKWRKVWEEKQRAFPDLYKFSNALKLSTVSALTDYFITHHSNFATARDYFDAYDLSGETLAGVNAHILAAADDPIIDIDQFRQLPNSLEIEITELGGHGAYMEDWGLNSWVDGYAARYFTRHLIISSA